MLMRTSSLIWSSQYWGEEVHRKKQWRWWWWRWWWPFSGSDTERKWFFHEITSSSVDYLSERRRWCFLQMFQWYLDFWFYVNCSFKTKSWLCVDALQPLGRWSDLRVGLHFEEQDWSIFIDWTSVQTEPSYTKLVWQWCCTFMALFHHLQGAAEMFEMWVVFVDAAASSPWHSKMRYDIM